MMCAALEAEEEEGESGGGGSSGCLVNQHCMLVENANRVKSW